MQVLAKSTFRDTLLQVGIGCRDDAHIRCQAFVAADSFKRSILKNAKQLYLHVGRHISDFIEEQRAPIRHLEPSHPSTNCPCKSAFFVAKQFAFQQLLGHSGTIERDKRLVAAAGVLVHVTCDNFFTST